MHEDERRGNRRGGGASPATTDAGGGMLDQGLRSSAPRLVMTVGPGCHRKREVVGSDLAGQKGHFASPHHPRCSTCRVM